MKLRGRRSARDCEAGACPIREGQKIADVGKCRAALHDTIGGRRAGGGRGEEWDLPILEVDNVVCATVLVLDKIAF